MTLFYGINIKGRYSAEGPGSLLALSLWRHLVSSPHHLHPPAAADWRSGPTGVDFGL